MSCDQATQATLIEMEPVAMAVRPAHNAREIRKLEAEIESLEGEIELLQEDIEFAEEKISRLHRADTEWPDKWTLLAVYGAPGNWPVAPVMSAGEQR